MRSAEDHLPACNRVPVAAALSQGTVHQPVKLAWKATGLLGEHPAGIRLLEGGRNLLLESAQEATL